jgi:putative ABC transport system permease protein
VRFLLLFLSLRYWLRHKGAFLLASLGVALGIAVFVSIQIANASVLNAFSASIDAVSGTANLQIRGSASGLPDSLFARILEKDDSRITAATPRVSRTLYSPTLKTSVLVNGVDFFSEIDFHDLDTNAPQSQSRSAVRANAEPVRFLLDPSAIAVSQSLAQKNGLKIGSPVEFNVGTSRKTFRVASILDEAQSGRAFGGDYALLDIAAAQEALGSVGKLSQIDLRVADDQVASVARELRRISPPDAAISPPAQRGAQIGAMLGAFRLNLTALSSIAAFVGAFLIYNALASAVVRRRSEAAILRSVGASGAQITLLFLIEAAFIGALGASVGFGLGVVLAKWTLGAVATTVSQLYIAVKARELFVPLWLLPFSVGAGTVLSVLAAFPSAREASLASPRAGLSTAHLHSLLERLAPRLALFGLALLALALVLSLPLVSGVSPLLGFGAAGATMGGFCLLVPWTLMRLARGLRPIGERLGGIEGALAADNTRRALNRSSLVVAALLVSIALIVGMNWMVGSFRATVGDWIDNTISADVFLATSDGFSGQHGPGLPREVIAWATRRADVRTFDTLRQADVEIGGQQTLLLANELPSFESGQRTIRWIETRGGSEAATRDYRAGSAVLLSERLSNLLHLRAGQQLSFPTPSGQKSFPIAGVFYDYNPNAVFYLSRPVYAHLWHDAEVDGIALYLNKTSGEEFKRQLFAHFGGKYALTVLPNREIRRQVFDTFDQTFAVTYALQLIALVVAGIGVFDTLASLMLERTTEMAGLRAMGASRGQILKTALWEFAFLGGVAWILGSLAGLILAAQMIFVINRQFFGWTIFPHFEPLVLLQALVLALGAALVAGAFPARQAARRDLASALQRE